MKVRIGSRTSDLARIQAYFVAKCLKEAHPSLEIDFLFKKSLGDINLHDPLWKMPEKGVFTQDLSSDLLNNECDLVVHSWKDLPTELPSGTNVFSTLKREDSRDLILFKKAWLRNPRSRLHILSSSPRRVHNLDQFLKEYLPSKPTEVVFMDIRGNIPTRLKKFIDNNSADALVVAKAALDRLVQTTSAEFTETKNFILSLWKHFAYVVVPLSVNPCAAAQGALAIEIRTGDLKLEKLLNTVNCIQTFSDVSLERQTLKAHGGGCHQKIGVSVRTFKHGTWKRLKGAKDNGEVLNETVFIPSKPLPVIPLNKIIDSKSLEIFNVDPISVEIPAEEQFLWISKADALPTNYIQNNSVVWCAGLHTWKKLSQRGYFVSGCNDSFGEVDEMNLRFLGSEPKWLKLSHEQGFGSPDKNFLSTYKLLPKNFSDEKLKQAELIFWSSASQYKFLSGKIPEIRSKIHACGFGHTFNVLSQDLGYEPHAFPSFELLKHCMIKNGAK